MAHSMIIKINKASLHSLLGEVVVPLSSFTGLSWAKDGMILSSKRTLFLGSLLVKIVWPTELKRYSATKENVNLAIAEMFAQIDKRYADKVKQQQQQKEVPTPEAAPAAPAV